MEIFDRSILKLRRENTFFPSMNSLFLCKNLYLAMFERFAANFSFALNIGFNGVDVLDLLKNTNVSISKLINLDIAYNPLKKANGMCAVVDLENLPFKKNSFDLVLSLGQLHSINNIEKFLFDIKNILKHKGIFVAMFPGGNTLIELKKSLIFAEENQEIIFRIFPFIDVKDAGRLMQKIGFGLSVSESEIINIKYKDIKDLFIDLKSLAETNILMSGIPLITKKTFDKMIRHYTENFFDYKENCFSVTLNMITITGIRE